MNETFEQLLSRLSEDQTLLRGVEEATKQGAVLPILFHLGWNNFNLQEVSPEFTVGNGRVDYCLRINQKKFVFLEVKRSTEDLDRHEKQLLEYSFTITDNNKVFTNKSELETGELGTASMIKNALCIRCGFCIDICPVDVISFKCFDLNG